MHLIFVVVQDSVQERNLDKMYLGFFVLELNTPMNAFRRGVIFLWFLSHGNERHVPY